MSPNKSLKIKNVILIDEPSFKFFFNIVFLPKCRFFKIDSKTTNEIVSSSLSNKLFRTICNKIWLALFHPLHEEKL